MIQTKWFIDFIVKEGIGKCVYLKRYWKSLGSDDWLGERLLCNFVDALEILQLQEKGTVIEINEINNAIMKSKDFLWQDNCEDTVSCVVTQDRYTKGDNNNDDDEEREYDVNVVNFIPLWEKFVVSTLRRENV